jgi:adenine-specific DNA-methyltransferase
VARKSLGPDTKVVTLTHVEASRKNIPTAEFESIVDPGDKSLIRVAIERRNHDLDPQLVWRGKDEQDAGDLIVSAPPLYIQEKVHPKALIDDLLRLSRERAYDSGAIMADLFSDFNGIPKGVDKTEFYKHDQNWSNRMILGDSLQVMASLAEREGLRGKVQCIYIDPPYGIKFNSNFQWSTTSRDVKDGDAKQITREPEQVKAFRDTWRDGIHSYLSYLRDRLSIGRDLLADSGSIFVQIGDENVHRLRALLDEVFGDDQFIASICFTTKGNQKGNGLQSISDNVLWYAKRIEKVKQRDLYRRAVDTGAAERDFGLVEFDGQEYRLEDFLAAKGLDPATSIVQVEKEVHGAKALATNDLTSGGIFTNQSQLYRFRGRDFDPGLKRNRSWTHTSQATGNQRYSGLDRLSFADRLIIAKTSLRRKTYLSDAGTSRFTNIWNDLGGSAGKQYVVQTNPKVIERCLLMATDPGDLVLDPTCGSGTTASVAEDWGRRWITIDTSRVALALARARVMGSFFPYYLLADSAEGQLKEAEISGSLPSPRPSFGDLRHGFVYERVRRITSTVVANNAEIDVIWDKWKQKLDPMLAALNSELKTEWEEWEVPRIAGEAWPPEAVKLHSEWWGLRFARQREIDASIAAKAEVEYLYDKPYEAKKTVRVAGPFTVESISPHRFVGVGVDDELLDPAIDATRSPNEGRSFVELMLDNLAISGVQQARKTDKISFTSLVPWPGDYICAEGLYLESDPDVAAERRAAIFIGPEFGTVLKADLTAAAREAADAGFDVLIACAFAYEAYASEVVKLGRLQILKARMNADLHMSEDLKKTDKANLFVIFGEPDIDVIEQPEAMIALRINGVDVFHPATGEVRSDGPDGIACWFIDTDYNEESFFVRHAYFLGANDPYDALKRTLKSEIDQAAWESLHSATSRAFPKPKSGRIAVKVINHLGDEVMKVFKVAP